MALRQKVQLTLIHLSGTWLHIFFEKELFEYKQISANYCYFQISKNDIEI